jgi:glucose-1-phosphate cytidylyltransferase
MGSDTATKKEMVDVGGRPIIWHVMKIFATYGHTHFILTLGHQGDVLKHYFAQYQMTQRDFTVRLGGSGGLTFHGAPPDEDWQVTLAETGLLTEKGSRIARVAPHIGDSTFFVTYGDGVGDIDVAALLAFHRGHGRLATLTGVKARWQYGLLKADHEGRVTQFEQKPRLEHWINGGFMVFEPRVLDYLTGGDDVHLERDTLTRLAAEGQLMMYRHEGFWRSMDTFKEAQELDAIWHESAPWKMWSD